MIRLFLDFETFYDVGYTLSSPKTAMSEYVRDPRFKAHMLQWAIDDGPLLWCDGDTIAKVLDEIWEQHAAAGIELVCQNTAFDGFILSHHYGKVPARYADTMLMSRALYGANVSHSLDSICARLGIRGKIKGVLESTKGIRDLPPDMLEKLAEYGVQDVDSTAQAYAIMLPQMPLDELDLIDLTLRMFCDPVLEVDVPRVQAELVRDVGNKVAKIMLAGVTADQLSSAEQFADLLRARGVQVPMKKSKTTGKPAFAFAKKDQEFLELQQHHDPKVRDLIEARLAIKSTGIETRCERFLKAAENGCKLPVLLNYCGAHTTRWSAGNKMNLQNLKRGGELRKSILAPKGYVIVVGDSSQIEARTNLWLAGDQVKLDIFRNYDMGLGPDLYRVMASMIYNKPIADVTPTERQVGKVCVLALGFQMGAERLMDTLATDEFNPMQLPFEECSRIVGVYRDANEPIVNQWEVLQAMLSWMITGTPHTYKCVRFETNRIILPSGLPIVYDGLTGTWNGYTQRFFDVTYNSRRGPVKLYGGLVCENVVQAVARCIVAEQMLAIAKRYRIVMMAHDEIAFLAPEEEAAEAEAFASATMKIAPAWAPGLPLNSEVKSARFYCK